MRKSLVAIIAVAIIGSLGIYVKGQDQKNSSQSTATLGQTTQPAAQSSDQTASSDSSGSSSTASGQYKDGTYKGRDVATEYGDVQIEAVISGGKITNVIFLSMPDAEGHSQEVTAFASPVLKQETLEAQTARVDFVSGATTSSQAYEQSIQYALDQAA